MIDEKKKEFELKTKSIMAMLIKFNSLFSRHQRETEETLLSWAAYLTSRNFTVKQVGFSLSELVKRGPVFMPSAHEIVGVLIPAIEPKEYRAEKIATEIHEAIMDTLNGNKVNFADEMAIDTKATVDALGGFRVLKESDFAKDWNRSRLVKGAMAVLTASEASIRNAKLTSQGISCTAISSFDIQKIELASDLAGLMPQRPCSRANESKNELKPLNLSTEEIGKEIREIRESINIPN